MERENEWRELDPESSEDLALWQEAAKIVSSASKSLEQRESKYAKIDARVAVFFDYHGPVVVWNDASGNRVKGVDFGRLEVLPHKENHG